MSRRAKIVCTLGPATSSPEQVAGLVAAGLDVARLNMSHGDHDAHRAAYDAVRAAGDAGGRSVGVLVDLQGPKIRLGRFAAGPVTLAAGQDGPPQTTGDAIARAAGEVGAAVGARALVAFTMTGDTARRLARCRSPIPLLAFTTESATRSQLALTWGAETFLVPPAAHTDDMVRQVDAALRDIGRCTEGDLVVIVAGSPPGTPGRTNALRVHRIGDAVES
jgi:pyruvate kinase